MTRQGGSNVVITGEGTGVTHPRQTLEGIGAVGAPEYRGGGVQLATPNGDFEAPKIPTGQSFVYLENQATGYVVGLVVASDNDLVVDFRFAATGTDTSADGFFTINRFGAIIMTEEGAAGPMNDFEVLPNTFLYSIQAKDRKGNWSPAVGVSVNVSSPLVNVAPQVTPAQNITYFDGSNTSTILGTILATGPFGVRDFRFEDTGTRTSLDGFFILSGNGAVRLTSSGVVGSPNDPLISPNVFVYNVQAQGNINNVWGLGEPVTFTEQASGPGPVIDTSITFTYAEGQTEGFVVANLLTDIPADAFRFADSGTNLSADGFLTVFNEGTITLTADGSSSFVATNDYESASRLSFSILILTDTFVGAPGTDIRNAITGYLSPINTAWIGPQPLVIGPGGFGIRTSSIPFVMRSDIQIQTSEPFIEMEFRIPLSGTVDWSLIMGTYSTTKSNFTMAIGVVFNGTTGNTELRWYTSLTAFRTLRTWVGSPGLGSTLPTNNVLRMQNNVVWINEVTVFPFGHLVPLDFVAIKALAATTNPNEEPLITSMKMGQAVASFSYAIEARTPTGIWGDPANVVFEVTNVEEFLPVVYPNQVITYTAGGSAGIPFATVKASDDVGVVDFKFTNGTTFQSVSFDGFYIIDSVGQVALTLAGASGLANVAAHTFTETIAAFDSQGSGDPEQVTFQVT